MAKFAMAVIVVTVIVVTVFVTRRTPCKLAARSRNGINPGNDNGSFVNGFALQQF
ncbi:MAG: hypothetical protein AAGA40_10275 [Cyanobacteria bacterium P01_E01_bin.45]